MTVRILTGDALQVLRGLPDQSVQCCVTSPPYYAQRSYLETGDPLKAMEMGQEPTLEAFVADLVGVFEEVRRVLRDDGTLWVNIGDTASSGGRGGGGSFQHEREAWAEKSEVTGWRETPGVNRKNKLLIPFRFALAMQAAGWVVRQDNIWSKPNAFPESVSDRTSTAHEYLFHFSKPSLRPRLWRDVSTGSWARCEPDLTQMVPNPSTNPEARAKRPLVRRWAGFHYYYEADAIAEPSSPNTHARVARGRSPDAKWGDGGPGGQTIAGGQVSAGRIRHGVGPKTEGMDGEGRVRANADFQSAVSGEVLPMRNKRSVWEVHTAQYADSHFATFPPELVEPVVLAACPRGGVVLDPFAGSGTTGQVAAMHGREAVLIDLNPANVRMMENRLRDLQVTLPFA